MQTNVHEAGVRHGGSAILVGGRDLEILRRIIARAGGHVSARLHGALQHVVVVPQPLVPTDVVSLGSTVVVECSPGGRRDLVVVEPWFAKGGPDSVSVLEPLGSALLGMAEGETVEVQSSEGGTMSVRIVAVNPGGNAA